MLKLIIFMTQHLIILTLIQPVLGVFSLLCVNSHKELLQKKIALGFSISTFLISLLLWVFFDKSTGMFQYVVTIPWLPHLNINFILGVDGISLFFIILTTLLVFLCFLVSWDSVKKNVKEYLIYFFLIEFFLLASFFVLDILLFYFFFESILIPMFLIIGIWGSRERKVKAAYYFFFFTLASSSFMLVSVGYIWGQVGTTSYEILLSYNFSELEQKILWFAFFLSFATKMPMVPFHLWLPEAHVEAPTAGSIILAGILLKLGTYGFIRYSLPLFPKACFYFSPLVYTLAVISIIYSSLIAIRQSDLKRVIAYTSIAHMNLVVLGIFSFNVIGIEGALIQSISHGFVSSALFFIIGIIYDRHHTRIINYYGGLVHVMPLYSSMFLFFSLANMGFPGTSSFVGELLILMGIFKINTTVSVLAATGVVISGAYSLWLCNRIIYGNLKTVYMSYFVDLNKREFVVLMTLFVCTLVTGLCPDIILESTHMSVNMIVEHMYF